MEIVHRKDSPAASAFWRTLLLHPLTEPFRGLLVLYFIFLVLLPSGSIFGVNVKIITFTALVPLALQVAFTAGRMTRSALLLILSVLTATVAWCFVSQWYGFDPSQSVAQSKDILVTIATCAFSVLLCRDSFADSLSLLRTVVLIEIGTSTIKVLMLVYALLRGIPVSDLIERINSIFGVQLMPFDFESMLGRLQFISDNLIPVCVFAILTYRSRLRFSPIWALLLLFVLLISDFFSFSRYLWVLTVLALLLGLALGKKDRFQISLITVLTLIVLAALPVITTVISLRFSSSVTGSSDAERTQQLNALHNFILDAPWIGHGLGSYTTQSIRSETALYSYEAQLQALLGQVGMVGVLLLTLLTAFFYRRLWPARGTRHLHLLGIAILLLAWLAGGLLNPSVISSAASVSYVALYAMANLEALPENTSA